MKKVIKIILMVIALALFVGVIIFFIRGIHFSLFADDVKTAQNRIDSAYQFLIMLIFGLCLIASLIGVYSIKVQIFPDKIAKFLGYNVEEKQETQEETEVEEVLEEPQIVEEQEDQPKTTEEVEDEKDN